MHTTTQTHSGPTSTTGTAERRLRRVLLANAATSTLGGAAALAAGPAVADLLGTDAVGWVRLVGTGLMGFAAFVVWVATGPTPRLRGEVPAISIGDLAWVVASGVTIALGWYSDAGAVVVAAVAGVVGTFGVMQLASWRRLDQTTASPTGVS